jgi:hypothetical protein
MNQTPTIGRIVHVWGERRFAVEMPAGPDAAIVVGIQEDPEVVDLVVFRPNGIFHQNGVRRSDAPAEFRWTWPPRV